MKEKTQNHLLEPRNSLSPHKENSHLIFPFPPPPPNPISNLYAIGPLHASQQINFLSSFSNEMKRIPLLIAHQVPKFNHKKKKRKRENSSARVLGVFVVFEKSGFGVLVSSKFFVGGGDGEREGEKE